MATVDEVNRETIQRLENLPRQLWHFIQVMHQIYKWNEERQNNNLKELRDNYYDKLKDLDKVEKELHENYKALYDKSMETKDFTYIMPQTYNDIYNNKNDFNKNDDFKLFINEYCNEYEDLTFDEVIDESGNIDLTQLDYLTDFNNDVMQPIQNAIQKEKEQAKQSETLSIDSFEIDDEER